jgi:hypothetical protein
MFTLSTLFALSVHTSSGAAVLAPAKRMWLRAVISASELSVYWSSFLPVTGLRDVTLSFEPPRIDEWSEM